MKKKIPNKQTDRGRISLEVAQIYTCDYTAGRRNIQGDRHLFSHALPFQMQE